MNTIIFSDNSPSKLRLLLESISKNFNKDNNCIINILYNSDKTENEYDKLKKEVIIPNINWIVYTNKNLKENLIESMYSNSNEIVCFLKDNDVIFDKVFSKYITEILKNDNDVFTFSLKLGLNTKTCYNLNCENILIPLEKNENIIIWDWTKHYADFGYPLSLDGHVFRIKDISKLIKNIKFSNLLELEENLQIFDNYPKNKMSSFLESKLISIIYNENNTELNEQYLNGKTIDFNSLNFSEINGCHQEIELLLK